MRVCKGGKLHCYRRPTTAPIFNFSFHLKFKVSLIFIFGRGVLSFRKFDESNGSLPPPTLPRAHTHARTVVSELCWIDASSNVNNAADRKPQTGTQDDEGERVGIDFLTVPNANVGLPRFSSSSSSSSSSSCYSYE